MNRSTTLFLLLILSLASCAQNANPAKEIPAQKVQESPSEDFYQKLAAAAFELTKDKVTYDPAYYVLTYPNGDVPPDKGVCTDVVIRAYRKMGIDLQKEVHIDMKKNFTLYPSKRKWGLTRPDKNIDHRRVLNLQVYFTRFGTSVKVTDNASDYLPGDIVTWDLGGGVTHIGIVANHKVDKQDRYQIVHNIGRGQVLEDCLFDWTITGHYRYDGTVKM
ncbi:MAG: DUF1287 domain-containing protein [Dysgonomonas sp.]